MTEEEEPGFWENRRDSLTKLRGNIAKVRKFVQDLPTGTPDSNSAAKNGRQPSAVHRSPARSVNEPVTSYSPMSHKIEPTNGNRQKPPTGNARLPPRGRAPARGGAPPRGNSRGGRGASNPYQRPNGRQNGDQTKDRLAQLHPDDDLEDEARMDTVSCRALSAGAGTLSRRNSRSSSPLFNPPMFSQPMFKPFISYPKPEVNTQTKPRTVVPPKPKPVVQPKPTVQSKPKTDLRTTTPPSSAGAHSADSERMVPFARLSPSIHLHPTGTPESILGSEVRPRRRSRDRWSTGSSDLTRHTKKPADIFIVDHDSDTGGNPTDQPEPQTEATNESEPGQENGEAPTNLKSVPEGEKKGDTPEKLSERGDNGSKSAWSNAQDAAQRRRRVRQRSADSALSDRPRDRQVSDRERKRLLRPSGMDADSDRDSDAGLSVPRRVPPYRRGRPGDRRPPFRGRPPPHPGPRLYDEPSGYPDRPVHSVMPYYTAPYNSLMPPRPASFAEYHVEPPIRMPLRVPMPPPVPIGIRPPPPHPPPHPLVDLEARNFHNFFKERYPHIMNDALIPAPNPRTPESPHTPTPVLLAKPPPAPAPVLVEVSSRKPVQNVYINTVTNNGVGAGQQRRPKIKVEVHDYLDDFDEEIYEEVIPDIIRECLGDLKSQDRFDKVRWERVMFEFQHDDLCQVQFVESLIATAIEDDILPELLTEMICNANEWLLDDDEVCARATLDDLMAIDLTIAIQALCRETMGELIDHYLRKHPEELTFEEVLALDWYDQTLTTEIYRIVQESLDELIYGEMQRRVCYEVYKQMLTELIRDVQDPIVAETLFEEAVLDPLMEESIIETVVDEQVPKIVQDALSEWSVAGLRELENDVRQDFGRWLLDSLAVDYVFGGFSLQGLTRFDSEGLDRALNSVLFDELFTAMLDINRCHRNTLENNATKFVYDKIFTGLAIEAMLDRLVEETDQNICDADADEVEEPGMAVLEDADVFLFGTEDKYRTGRRDGEMVTPSPAMSNRGTEGEVKPI